MQDGVYETFSQKLAAAIGKLKTGNGFDEGGTGGDDTEFGLASYFYANDLVCVFRVAEALEYGIEEFTELKYVCLVGIK